MEKTRSVEVITMVGEEQPSFAPYDPFEFEMDVVPPSAPPSTKRSNAFVKTKQGKMRWALLPHSIREGVKALEYGAKKHGEFNWKGVPDARTYYFEACMRHLTDWYWDGLEEDPESGLHPLAHLVADALILLARKIDGTL